MDDLVQKALDIGFTNAVRLDGLKLECEEQLRAYCNPEGCPNHGNNWVCPPGCGSLSECQLKVRAFDSGVLLQSISEIDEQSPDYKGPNREHNLRLRRLLEEYEVTDMEVLALTSGGCVFCETCAYPEPCIKPDVRMNSLSAFGIDVGKLCKMANLDYSFRPDRVYYIALVLTRVHI